MSTGKQAEMFRNTSAIILNYNYAPFLERRIASIVNQTSRPAEIVFLDDCSTDNSLDTAERLLSKSPVPWRIIKNSRNQGVFKQWLKGIEASACDYVWICEADDYCQPDLLSTLLPAFADADVVLAYCQSRFVDLSGNHICNYDNYITRYFDFSRWTRDYKAKGIDEITNFLCCINTIPNASSVVLNKKRLDMAQLSQIADYENNGDWFFYILALSASPENLICYFHSPLNNFVRHQGSVFGSEDTSSRPIVEFINIMTYVLEHFSIHRDVKEVMLRSLVGNLIYWPVDPELNSVLADVMSYLPQENLHLIYSQETDHIVSRFKHKIEGSEKVIQEQKLLIDDLSKRIAEYGRQTGPSELLRSSFIRLKQRLSTLLRKSP